MSIRSVSYGSCAPPISIPGEPTGILKETAAGLVTRVVPAPTREEQLEALDRALAEARRYGITSIQEVLRHLPRAAKPRPVEEVRRLLGPLS